MISLSETTRACILSFMKRRLHVYLANVLIQRRGVLFITESSSHLTPFLFYLPVLNR